MTKFLIIILMFTSVNIFSQSKHTADNCQKCYCTKWHQTFYIDTETNEKVIVLLKQKKKGCSNGKNCKTLTVDGYCKYKSKTYQYYSNGKLHLKEIEKGWNSGWGGSGKVTKIFYDTNGKMTTKKRFIKVV